MQVEGINRRLVKFIWAAAIFFAWTLIQGAVQAQEPVRLFMEAGPGGMIGSAHTHVGLMGWMSVALMVAIYYIVPSLSGKSIVWPKLIEWIFWIFVVCTAVGSILMIIGGIIAGSAFAAGVKGAQLEGIIVPFAMPASLLCTISVIAGLMLPELRPPGCDIIRATGMCSGQEAIVTTAAKQGEKEAERT